MWYELFSNSLAIFLIGAAYVVGFLISFAVSETLFNNKVLYVIPFVSVEGFITLGVLAFLELGGLI